MERAWLPVLLSMTVLAGNSSTESASSSPKKPRKLNVNNLRLPGKLSSPKTEDSRWTRLFPKIKTLHTKLYRLSIVSTSGAVRHFAVETHRPSLPDIDSRNLPALSSEEEAPFSHIVPYNGISVFKFPPVVLKHNPPEKRRSSSSKRHCNKENNDENLVSREDAGEKGAVGGEPVARSLFTLHRSKRCGDFRALQ